MANLLPQQYMKKVRRERALRVTVVILLFVLGTMVLAGIFLVPSLLLSRSKQEGVTSQVELLQTFIQEREESDVSATVRETRSQLGRLSAVVESMPAADVVASLVDVVGQGVVVRSLSYEKVEGEEGVEGTLRIEGEASGRMTLLAFVKALEREELFEGVDLPVSNLAARTNIGFSLTAAVVQNNE